MSQFPTAAHLASWAGVCPGHHESAGRVERRHPARTTTTSKAALGNAAIGAARTKNSYLQTRYRRLAGRTSTLKALVAVEHAIITAIWHMLTTGSHYRDLGADYYQRRDPRQDHAPHHQTSQRHRTHRPLRPHRTTHLATDPATQGRARPPDLLAASSRANRELFSCQSDHVSPPGTCDSRRPRRNLRGAGRRHASVTRMICDRTVPLQQNGQPSNSRRAGGRRREERPRSAGSRPLTTM